MVRPAKRSATYQDVLDAPEHLVAELIDGELYLQADSPKKGSFEVRELPVMTNPRGISG